MHSVEFTVLQPFSQHNSKGFRRSMLYTILKRLQKKIVIIVGRAIDEDGKGEYHMYLHDNLRNCLLAMASRYPYHVIDINNAVLGQQTFAPWNWAANEIMEAWGWTAEEIIDLFDRHVPHLLQMRADLTIDQDRCVIHLPEYSIELPAFWLHCRGKLPPHRGETFRSFAT